MACDKQFEPALIKMAQLLIEGQKIEKDIDKAINYLKTAESNNNQFAQYMLGKLFYLEKMLNRMRNLQLSIFKNLHSREMNMLNTY